MKSVKFQVLAGIILSVLCLGLPGHAQTSSGEIRGRVVDPGNAVIVGAQVTLTNQNTSETRSAKTNNQGEFVFVAVQPGTYEVSVTSKGFKTLDKRDLVLTAADRLS